MKSLRRMAAILRPQQQIHGNRGIYRIYQHARATPKGDIWLATNDENHTVVVKTANQYYLNNEREILKRYQGHSAFRQLVDETQDPPALVLEYLDDNALDASTKGLLNTLDIKQTANCVLEALAALHENDFTHTDIKPDNILVNYGNGNTRFRKVKLADCGDTIRANDVGDFTKHVIGAEFFRSPEALLMQQWDTPTDIWSFGATLLSLFQGGDIFKPSINQGDEAFIAYILQRQHMFFGPFSLEDMRFMDKDALYLLQAIMQETKESGLFFQGFCKDMAKQDSDFIRKIMKLNPRDRPSAKGLLEDAWFHTV